ncbi:DUF2536 family protein [Jeotgalibacillus campisalis]|uniref:DUF2536 family protein n=1 Tax=Jeotgalibacillus campisalis TaxID=220754 RepID=A0A0C2VAX9_9BACL|nr:DUF2536 family protein [Jeotgalibacillus campisalis]KIL46077.1 hypothetical protein KR50_27520 [Jeotgalibacillus campisalis]
MSFQIELIQDKVEFFEAYVLNELERKIEVKIEQNHAIMLQLHSVSHAVLLDNKGRTLYTAVAHFKAK